ncbi:Uncharacterized iron-regulated membrane protein [Sphingobium sp. YR657]|uniref:PepSY-associated TM helix domain-containing protein n=1 Tax=Sphingobium sp. YR657 TaxID=1884366 RepID=UPI0009162BE8|nr:PepSY-associated TM helix domain-containing protein [Sphingobium sp. YR657]SHL52834.1 Uncharacterized iron-regulated membrane protein [Sphingobium sp. YR657]
MPARLRSVLVRLHRWIGLTIALFLVVTGLTGSVLAFREPLDRWLNPELFVVPIERGGAPLPLAMLAQRIERALPEAEPIFLPLHLGPGQSMPLVMRPRPGATMPLGYNQAFFDPHDGSLLGTRDSGASLFERRTTVGFLYRLHRQLALPAVWGSLVLGIVSMLWTIDSLTGFALTLPIRSNGKARKSWWHRWRTAWTVKSPASAARRTLDLHRAGGLWLWGMLIIFGWSSVMLSMEPVYRAVMSRIVSFDEPRRSLPIIAPEKRDIRLGWQDALAAGRDLLPEAAARYGFTPGHESELALDRNRNLYIYYVRSDRDIRDEGGSTGLFIDARTGGLLAVSLPSKPGAAGNAFTQWMYGLHMAQVFGFPYRLFIAAFGLVVAGLSVTGVLIWRTKSRRRRNREMSASILVKRSYADG